MVRPSGRLERLSVTLLPVFASGSTRWRRLEIHRWQQGEAAPDAYDDLGCRLIVLPYLSIDALTRRHIPLSTQRAWC